MMEMIGSELKRQRRQAKLDQEGLAKKIGVTRETISRWETTGQLGVDQLARYCQAIGLSPRWLWAGLVVAGASEQELMEIGCRIIRRDV